MIQLQRTGFNEKNTYQAYKTENIYKCDSNNLKTTLQNILKTLSNERILIELPSTIGLTDEIIESLTDNIDVRIIGGLTNEYAVSHKFGNNMDYFREKATYSKEELKNIMSKIKSIEEKIDSNWNEYEKALYLYEYVKCNIVYRKPNDIGPDNKALDSYGNRDRTRTWDTLIGLSNQLSTCSGFAHIYQELCTRQNIKCVKVGGKYNTGREGSHAWNVITIDNKNFLVDIIWDAQEFEKGNDITTGFALQNIENYVPHSYHEINKNITPIDRKIVQNIASELSKRIPKQQIANERIENFLKLKEADKKRMMQLRQGIFENSIINENTLSEGRIR